MTDNHEPQAYPLNIRGDLSSPPNRGLWLIKWILAIPHFIVLIVLSIVGFVLTIIAFFAILFTARYPRGIFNFNVGVSRWWWRVSFYAGVLGTDRYPPFSLRLTTSILPTCLSRILSACRVSKCCSSGGCWQSRTT